MSFGRSGHVQKDDGTGDEAHKDQELRSKRAWVHVVSTLALGFTCGQLAQDQVALW